MATATTTLMMRDDDVDVDRYLCTCRIEKEYIIMLSLIWLGFCFALLRRLCQLLLCIAFRNVRHLVFPFAVRNACQLLLCFAFRNVC